MDTIKFWNRNSSCEEVELVYGDVFVKWLYQKPLGQQLTDKILTRAFISKLYGIYQSSVLSRRKINSFIRDFKIDMNEYEPGPFKSFNDFFIRRFQPGRRKFIKTPEALPAFAEARYLGFEKIKPDQVFPVKGEHLSSLSLLGRKDLAKSFKNGPLLIARLCPVDYHRFHYPDDGTTSEEFRIGGVLHSVNPIALRFKSDIFSTNERHVSILETENFGRLAYIEVGALCVGKIVQSHPKDSPFKKGDEKGYFLFGGSTVILLGEEGRWKPDKDILEQTRRNQETFIRLGDRVAQATSLR